MADMAFTAAEIRPLPSHGAIIVPGTAGGTITVGHLVYIASDGDWERADGNVSAAVSRAQGVAVESYDGETTINAGDPVSVVVFGPVSGFDALTAGANYYASDTVGRIADATGTFDRQIGFGMELAGEVVLFVHPQQNDPSSA
jgi:hypothetical protein